MTAPEPITPQTLKCWLHDGHEIALLDVREHGEFGEGHLFYANSLPYSRLELDVGRLVPRAETRIVLCDGGANERISRLAGRRLAALGYSTLAILIGGIDAWRQAGYAVFKGVNVPSKAFGELIEAHRHTPTISAHALATRLENGEELIILDGRPFDEFQKMSIPGAISCPNGELALRLPDLLVDEETPVVINCAGRTRGLIGAQTLIDLGFSNPVFALENGTQGWVLAGHALERGSTQRHALAAPSNLQASRVRARQLAARHDVPVLDDTQAQACIDDPTRNTWLLDVRTPEEFAAGTATGALSAPGGQLVQANDQTLAVRQGQPLLIDDDGVRAAVTASWLRQMGFDAKVIARGIDTGVRMTRAPQPVLATLQTMTAAALAEALRTDTVQLIDVRSSKAFRSAHLVSAIWSIRPHIGELAERIDKPVVLVADEVGIAQLAALDIQEVGQALPRLLAATITECAGAGIALATSNEAPAAAECIDFLFFVHDRHEGNLEASRQYLAWEVGLIKQLDPAELDGFRINASPTGGSQR